MKKWKKCLKKWMVVWMALVLSTTTVSSQNQVIVSASAEIGSESNSTTLDFHADVDFSDIKYEKYKPEKFYALIEEGRKLCEIPGKKKEVFDIYNKELDEFDIMYTSMQVNDIHYYKDNSNEYFVKQQTYCQELSEKMQDEFGVFIKAIIDSEYEEAFEKKVGSELIEEYKEYKPLTEKQKKLSKQERKLVQEYDSTIMKPYSVTVDGTRWTQDKLDSADDLDYEKYVNIYTQLEQKKNEAVGNIFVKLVKVRAKIAKTYGYSNYADYMYEKGYHRDYTTKDTEELYDLVREYLAPIWLELQMDWSSEDQSALSNTNFTEDEIISNLGKYTSELSDELTPAYEYMTKHHLYDISSEETKMDIGYTTELSEYNAPFIFYKPYGNYWDMKTMIHEFGHYNNFYQVNEPAFYEGSSLDLAEVHSQGLEMLFLDYFNNIYGDAAASVKKVQFIDLLSSVIEGCIYDEFQVEVYENPDMSLKEMNQLMRTIGDSYNYPYYDSLDEAYGWVDVSHTFQSPLYYISYATSALGAFDIWKLSTEDKEKAIETYLNLTKIGSEMEFNEALVSNGLQNIFSEEYIKELADTLKKKCLEKDEKEEAVETVETVQGNQALIQKKEGILIAGAAVGVVVLLILVLVIVQKRRKKHTF